ncbi:MAG: DUF2784 domain-containing protein [Desulfuromonadales bacterium]|nr:DUF2784 domain-containing protein [Desulfuromonadales bacterium]
MDLSALFILAADAVLLLHVLVVIFIVLGLVLIFIGNFHAWHWVRNPWFRLLHLLAICVVILLSWLSLICPLTSIEMALRTRAGNTAYPGSFISHWLEIVLYYQAPPWVFVICYTLFGVIVVTSWFWVRPRRFFNSGGTHTT